MSNNIKQHDASTTSKDKDRSLTSSMPPIKEEISQGQYDDDDDDGDEDNGEEEGEAIVVPLTIIQAPQIVGELYGDIEENSLLGNIVNAIEALQRSKICPNNEKLTQYMTRNYQMTSHSVNLAINKFLNNGKIIAINYRGNISYRTPNDKTKLRGKYLNSPEVHQNLLKALDRLHQKHLQRTTSVSSLRPTSSSSSTQVLGLESITCEFSLDDLMKELRDCCESQQLFANITDDFLRTLMQREINFAPTSLCKKGKNYYIINLKQYHTLNKEFAYSPNKKPKMEEFHSVYEKGELEPIISASTNSLSANDIDLCDMSTSEVYDRLCILGHKREAEVFCQEEIDGSALLLMTRDDILQRFNFKFGPAVKLFQAIQSLILKEKSAGSSL